MSYLQLSILGIPARIILGDTLAKEKRQILYTPAYFYYDWHDKIEAVRKKQVQAVNIMIDENKKEAAVRNYYSKEELEVFAKGSFF